MLKFVRSECIAQTLQKLVGDASAADLAVSYWGKGGGDRLNISSNMNVRIICDLMSGGCNPYEIARLKTIKSVKIFHLDRLHAKVYWTPNAVLIGSPNASSNGLGDEGDIGLIEAGLLTDDTITLKEVSRWFEDRLAMATPVNKNLIAEAKAQWLRRTPKPNPKDSVLTVLFRDPDWFRRRLWITDIVTDPSELAIQTFEQVMRDHYSERQIEGFNQNGYPFFEASLEEDSHVDIRNVTIDLSSGPLEVFEITPLLENNAIILCKPTAAPLGLKFPANERALIRQAVRKHKTEGADFSCNIEDLHDLHRDTYDHIQRAFRLQSQSDP